MGNREVYQKITDRMIAALKNGTVPWHKAWTADGGGRPRSMSARSPYRGINVLLLIQVRGSCEVHRRHKARWATRPGSNTQWAVKQVANRPYAGSRADCDSSHAEKPMC
jgi:hypothetical protein